MIDPYYHDPAAGILIYHGDCTQLHSEIARQYVIDLICTDPPYGAKEKTNRGTRRNNGTLPHQSKKRMDPLKGKTHAPIAGDDRPFDPAALLQLGRPTILWGANYYADKLPASRSWLVWDKREDIAPDDNADCELAWSNLDRVARIYRHLWRGVCRRSESGGSPLHPTQKPVALMRWCLHQTRLKPGALVYDPYMGSGPLAQACKELGYRYIGIELHKPYCDIAINRLSQEVMLLAS